MGQTGKSERVVWYDLLNICACLCVVFLHHNGLVHSYFPTAAWAEALGVEVLAYWAVPVFLMLSGATLMGYRTRYSTKEFFKRRLLRTLIPFLLWTAIAAAVMPQMSDYALPDSFSGWFDLFLNYRPLTVYWFFPLIFSVYLLMPVLSLFVQRGDRRILWYIVGAIFVTHSLPAVILPSLGLPWNPAYEFPVTGYALFVVLGYLLSTADLSRRVRGWIYAGGVFGAVWRYAGIFLLSTRDGVKNEVFFGYTYAPSVLLACAVFVFFRYGCAWLENRKKSPFSPRVRRILSELSACSLGVYLIHMLWITAVFAKCPWLTPDRRLWRWVFPFVTYGVCAFVVWIVRKIPFLRRIFP